MQQHRKTLIVFTRRPQATPTPTLISGLSVSTIPAFVGKDAEARKSFAHMHLMSLCQQFNVHLSAEEHREYALAADEADDLSTVMLKASELIVEKLKAKKLLVVSNH